MRLIDKDELIAFIKANGFVYANTLETFPEIDAVPVVRGEWIKDNRVYGYCSHCGHFQDVVKFGKYCPNCGAKMEGKQDE